MNRSAVLRVVLLMVFALILGMAMQPAKAPRSAYQKATENLAVPSARADHCPNPGKSCLPLETGFACQNDPSVPEHDGCIQPPLGSCYNCTF